MSNVALTVRYVLLSELEPYSRNARTHSPAQIAKLQASLLEYGWTVPIAVAGRSLIAGHGRLAAAIGLRDASKPIPGLADQSTAPVIDLSHLSPQKRRAYVIADNRLALDAGWDLDTLRDELSELRIEGYDLTLTGFDLPEISEMFSTEQPTAEQITGSGVTLAERFGVPPFSVLTSRETWWQDRKRAWIALGIQSEIGRSALSFTNQAKLDTVGRRK